MSVDLLYELMEGDYFSVQLCNVGVLRVFAYSIVPWHLYSLFLIFICLNCFSYSCTLCDFQLRSFELITKLMLVMSLVEVCLIMSVLILYYIYGS